MCVEDQTVYMGFGTIDGFRHLPGVLEHVLARMWGLRAGHLILLGFLLHSGFNFTFLLSNELFLVKDIHVHFSRLGRSNPKPPVSLSWGG